MRIIVGIYLIILLGLCFMGIAFTGNEIPNSTELYTTETRIVDAKLTQIQRTNRPVRYFITYTYNGYVFDDEIDYYDLYEFESRYNVFSVGKTIKAKATVKVNTKTKQEKVIDLEYLIDESEDK